MELEIFLDQVGNVYFTHQVMTLIYIFLESAYIRSGSRFAWVVNSRYGIIILKATFFADDKKDIIDCLPSIVTGS